MKKILMFFLGLFLLFSSYEPVFATGTRNEPEPESYKWFKVEASVPTDFEFTMTVVVELLNQKTGEKTIVNVKNEDDYISYVNVTPGEYMVSSVQVPGNYEGYFTFGYPENVFIIREDSKETTVIPVIAELHLPDANQESSEDQNLFEGMTYDEVMDHVAAEEQLEGLGDEVAGENILNTQEKMDVIIGEIKDEMNESGVESPNDAVNSEESTSLEDKIAEEKAEQEKEIYGEQAEEEQSESLLGGLVVMCLAFIGLGVGYYLVKRKM